MGSLNVLNFALRQNAKVFFTSTSEVYGDPEVHPQPESYKGSVNPTGIRACYDEGKRCAESLFYAYNRYRVTTIEPYYVMYACSFIAYFLKQKFKFFTVSKIST